MQREPACFSENQTLIILREAVHLACVIAKCKLSGCNVKNRTPPLAYEVVTWL